VNSPDPLRTPRLLSRDYVYPDDAAAPRSRRWLVWTAVVVTSLVLTPPAAVFAMRWIPPPTSAFMLQSPVRPVQYQWVPAERIPQTLRRAVIAAEDQKFWTHRGFDFEAISRAMEHNRNSKRVRGASTITQQVAKNLFLWPSRSYLRKGLEVTFTVLLEALWPKERILEVYLNVAEFGPGVYGVQAAARKFFGKSSHELSAAETAQLAAVLPNPRKWRADRPGPYLQTRTDWILGQIGQRPRFSFFPSPEEEPLPEEPMPAEPELEPAGEPGVADGAEPAAPETFEPAEEPASEPATGPATGEPMSPEQPVTPVEPPAAEPPAQETEPEDSGFEDEP
jgi:monofunctional biosynthetic peptidoglycan transglycosylase